MAMRNVAPVGTSLPELRLVARFELEALGEGSFPVVHALPGATSRQQCDQSRFTTMLSGPRDRIASAGSS